MRCEKGKHLCAVNWQRRRVIGFGEMKGWGRLWTDGVDNFWGCVEIEFGVFQKVIES